MRRFALIALALAGCATPFPREREPLLNEPLPKAEEIRARQLALRWYFDALTRNVRAIGGNDPSDECQVTLDALSVKVTHSKHYIFTIVNHPCEGLTFDCRAGPILRRGDFKQVAIGVEE